MQRRYPVEIEEVAFFLPFAVVKMLVTTDGELKPVSDTTPSAVLFSVVAVVGLVGRLVVFHSWPRLRCHVRDHGLPERRITSTHS